LISIKLVHDGRVANAARAVLQNLPPDQRVDNLPREPLGISASRHEVKLRILRHLVRLIHAGEILDLAGERAGVQPLGINSFDQSELCPAVLLHFKRSREQ